MGYKIEDGITQSYLMSFLGCRQRFKYMADGWELEQTGFGDAMIQGSCFHHLLEKYYSAGFDPEESEDVLRDYIHEDFPKLLDPEPIIAMCCILFPYYLKYHKESDDKIKWCALEEEFDVEWNGFRLRGKIDGRFQTRSIPRSMWTFETKTTSQFPDGIQTGYALSFSFQNFFYALALKLLGHDIVGTVQNYIRMPQLKFNDPEDFANKLEASIAKNGIDYFFKRYPIVHSDKQKLRFETDLLAVLKEFKGFLEGDEHYPAFRNHSSCIGRGSCPFLAFCATNQPAGYTQTRTYFRELAPK